MVHLAVRAACCLAGVLALATAALYGQWVLSIRRGRVVVVRADHDLVFRVVGLAPLVIMTPILLVYHLRFPGTWGVAALLFYHVSSLAMVFASELRVTFYNLSEDDAFLAVRRALVLADMAFRERESRFLTEKDEPLLEVVLEGDRPEGAVRILKRGLPLYRLVGMSCLNSEPTAGASAKRFLLSALEFFAIGAGSLVVAFLLGGS